MHVQVYAQAMHESHLGLPTPNNYSSARGDCEIEAADSRVSANVELHPNRRPD